MTSPGHQIVTNLLPLLPWLLLCLLQSLPANIHGMPCPIIQNNAQCGCHKPSSGHTTSPTLKSDSDRAPRARLADFATSEDDDYYYIDDMAFRKVGHLASDKPAPLENIDLAFWPGGIVFFVVDPDFSTSYREKILAAMVEIQSRVGGDHLEFKEAITRENELCRPNYLHVISTDAHKCISEVGMQLPGKTKMWLNERACSDGTIQHELLHALGRYHEQCRTDRDKYVTLLLDNVAKTQCSNFNFHYIDPKLDLTLDLPYDSNSIMHYGSCYFTCNGKHTMLAKNGSVIKPNRNKMTVWDVEKVRRLFPADAKVQYSPTYMNCKPVVNSKRKWPASAACSLHGSSTGFLLLLFLCLLSTIITCRSCGENCAMT